MQTTQSFGRWLRQHRRALDLSQEEMADRIGCSDVTIRKIEAGVRRPSRQMAELLADLLKTPADEREAFIAFARGLDDVAPSTGYEAATGPPGAGRSALSTRLPGNLPIPITTLIGREAQLTLLAGLLKQDAVRLLTLTGAPGIGKTRLALQLGTDLVNRFPDGVWFVELAPLVDAKLVIPTTASALSVKEEGGNPILETLKKYLTDKQLLLVLDNFEHVADAAKEISQLLESSPAVKILATSRVPLRLRGEREYLVPPLSMPDARDVVAVEEAGRYEAISLFVERAQAVKADFELNDQNAAAVAQICVHLDGLPLAIELAAARVKMLPPQALLSRLSQRLKVLTGGPRDLSTRQQTLRGAIDWSYDLLSDGEKQLFRRMSVFQGGRTLEALEAVCNAERLQVEANLQLDVLDGVRSLLDKSLLQEREGTDSEPRFWMLETIHEYATEKLNESGEVEELQRQHALYFMRLAEEAEPHLTGAKQREWLNRLEDEFDNLRAALRWAIEDDQGKGETTEKLEIALRTAGAAWRYWEVRGYYSEGKEWLEKLLSLPTSSGWDAGAGERTEQAPRDILISRAKLLTGAGMLADKQGHYAVARSYYEQSLALRRELGDKEGTAGTLNDLGVAAGEHGDFDSSRSLFEQSLALKRELGDLKGIASALNNLGNLSYIQQDYPTARTLYEESLALKRELGDLRGIANTLQGLGGIAQEQGDYSTARALQEESLALRRELGDKSGIAFSLNNLGAVAQAEGDYVSARAMHEESLVLRRELGHKWIVFSLSGLGEVAVAEAASLGDKSGAVRGATLLGAVEVQMERMGLTLPKGFDLLFEQAVATARPLLGEEAFERAWQQGRAMSLDQAMAYALQESTGDRA